MKNKLLNKVLFFLAVAFFLISLLNVLVILQTVTTATTSRAVGQSSGQGYVRFCISYSPVLNATDQTLFAENPVSLQINYTNPNNTTLAFYDNTSLFEINSTTGMISFTPASADAGTYSILIGMNETASCKNITLTNIVSFYILSEIYNSTLAVWDDSDAKGGNQTRYRNEQAIFFANYTNSTNASINGSSIYCEIKFNITGDYTDPVSMPYNSTSSLYSYARSFNISGIIFWNAFCNGSSALYKNKNQTDNITIANRAPVLTTLLPNQTWNEDTILMDGDLDDYFTDPDNDSMNYSHTSVNNIRIDISTTSHIVTYSPDANWFGNRTVVFYATDIYNSAGESNLVYLTVIDVPETEPTQQQVLASASAGSLGGSASTTVIPFCEEEWGCSEWDSCLPTEIQTRGCTEISECGTAYRKPNESRSCKYFPTCSDLIKNQNETGVDCGGPCPACPTCYDGRKNQGEEGTDCGGPCKPCSTCFDGMRNEGEEGIDCGGPCKPCPTCYDGIKNQGEEGTDCGGPCRSCPKIEVPIGIKRGIIPLLLTIAVSALIFAFVSYRLRKYVHPFFARFLMKIMQLLGILKKEEIAPEELGLRDFVLFRLQQLENRMSREEAAAIFKDFSLLIKTFFKGIFQTKYEYTYEELMNAVEREKITVTLKIVIITFLKRLSDFEYAAVPINREKMLNLINEAKLMVDLTTRRPLIKKEKEVRRKGNLTGINELVSDTNKAIREGKMEAAVNFYRALIGLYNEMENEKKAKVYEKVRELHKSIEENIRKLEENEEK